MSTSFEKSGSSHLNQTVATRVITYSVRPGKDWEFQAWQNTINEKCQHFAGFLGVDVHAAATNETHDEWVVIYRFQSEASLKLWLDSKERAAVLEKTPDIFVNKKAAYTLSGNQASDQGVTIVTAHKVIPGKEAEHAAANKALNDAAARFPGFAGWEVFKPTSENDEYTTLIRFNNQENMNRWLTSPERKAGREALYRTTADHRTNVVATGFGSWFAFNAQDGIAAAAWKQAMVVLSALFPVVMMLNLTLGDYLTQKHIAFAENIFIGNAVGTIILTWLVMPVVSRLMNWWLSPRSSTKQAWLGLFCLLILYAIEITIFKKL